MTSDSDESLIEQYRSGNAAAFDRLYERYRVQVYNYIFRQVGKRNLAEDIFQDTWLRVIRSTEQWKPGGKFSSWLYRIAHNRLVDYWRQYQPEELDRQEDVNDAAARPEHQQFIQNCVERLKALLGRLKPEQRDAFVLQQESGLTLDQIALVMATGRETVKTRLRYAMKKLRAGLEGCDE